MVLCRSGNTLVATSCHVFIFTMAELIDARSLEFLTQSMPKLADGLCALLLIMPVVICLLCLRHRCDVSFVQARHMLLMCCTMPRLMVG